MGLFFQLRVHHYHNIELGVKHLSGKLLDLMLVFEHRAAEDKGAFSVGYGVVDELHQSAVPGRIASVLDVGIDALGAVAGVVAWRVISAWSGHRTLDDKAAYSARTTQAYRGN